MVDTPHIKGTGNKNKQLFRIIPWVGSGLFIVLLIVTGLILVTKQLVFVSSSTTSSTVTKVCSDAIIAKYNEYYTVDSDEAQKTVVKSAFDATSSLTGYEVDPNCVYIRYAYYYGMNETASAQKELDTLTALSKKGTYASSQITGVQQIDALQSELNRLKNPDQNQGAASGGQG